VVCGPGQLVACQRKLHLALKKHFYFYSPKGFLFLVSNGFSILNFLLSWSAGDENGFWPYRLAAIWP
jgi:hypothetical protein